MSSTKGARLLPAPPAADAAMSRRILAVAITGIGGTFVAMAATTLAAGLAAAVGVDFVVTEEGESIPLSGFAVVTGALSLVGVVLAVLLLRWSARPPERFVRTTVSLTAVSLVPPFLVEASTSTSLALAGLHLVAAAVMIPTLALGLRRVRSPLRADVLGEPVE